MKSCTPLRYPGGKAKLFPYIKELISENFQYKPIYVEPFAGGCGLALKLLKYDIVEKIIINDNDYAIYCFWYSILNYNKEFIKLIEGAHFSIEEWYIQKNIYLNQKKYSKLEVGFATFYLNRTNRSGIILAGPIGGKNQNGTYKMDCRFNKENLIKLIKDIYTYKKRIKLHHRDAVQFIKYIDKKYDNLFIYLDPPYVNKGKDLYKNHYIEKDHIKLSKAIRNLKNEWIVTYDKHPLIEYIYQDLHTRNFSLRYSIAGDKRGEEILIYKDSLPAKLDITEYL